MSIIRQLAIAGTLISAAYSQPAALGLFTNSGDVGEPAIKGSTVFDSSSGQYKMSGAGANIWAKNDQFQYLWKEIPGNFAITATMKFLGGGVDHRKAGIMLRQSLDADATYADVIVHGSGMPALQWRNRTGENTNAFDLPFDGPGTFKIKMVRNGIRIFMYLGKDGAELQEIVKTEVAFQNPVLVGLAVCSHEAGAATSVVFSDVSIEILPPTPAPKKQNAGK